ncbi:hypothetical protein SCUP515_02857 [Seiridium cupressi]
MNPTKPAEGAAFTIKRRPVMQNYQKTTSQASLPSVSSPLCQSLAQSLANQDVKANQIPAQQVAVDSCVQGESREPILTDDVGFPTPPPSASPVSFRSNQQFLSEASFFPPPPETNPLPTPPLSAQVSPQPNFSHAIAAPYDPSKGARPPYPLYDTTQTGSTSTQAPASSPRSRMGPSVGSGFAGSPYSPVSSNTVRLSTWSKEAVNKYWNKETAKKAYKNSKEFLVMANDKLGKVIDPLMPVISAINPDFAAAYQISQAVNQKPGAANMGLTGVLAGQAAANGVLASNQAPGGFGNFASILGAVAQVAVNDSADTSADVNPLLAALNQSATTIPSFTGGMDSSAYLATMSQDGLADTSTSAIASLLQQQSAPAIAALLANMNNNTQIPSSQNAIMDILAAAQSSQDFSLQLMNAMMEQQQAAQAAALANLAAYDSQPANSQGQFPADAQTPDPESAAGAQFSQGQSQGAQSAMPSNSGASTSSTPHPQSAPQPNSSEPRHWTRQRVPAFGLDDIVLPLNTGFHSIGCNLLVGNLVALSGHCEIRLLYTGEQVLHGMVSLQGLKSNDETTVLEPCSMIDFGIPCGGVSVACALCFNEADEDGMVPSMYQVIIQSPYGHGLALSCFTPAQHLDTAKMIAWSMVSSITWLDRSTICKLAPEKLLGKWRYEDEILLIDLGDGCASETKELKFTADGRYQYTRSGSAKVSTAPDVDQASGQFQIYEYDDGTTHLVLTQDGSGAVEVQTVKLRENSMFIMEKTYIKVAT